MLELLSHVSYAFAALSFILRDIFYLRIISILASGFMIAASCHPPHRWNSNVVWNILFILIHITQICITIYLARTALLSEEEQELHETLFRDLTKLEFLKLLRAGHWMNLVEGAMLTVQGEPVVEVMLISNGRARVAVDGREVAELRDGQIVGEMSFITGEPASATVTATAQTRCLAWSQDQLRSLLRRNPTLQYALHSVLNREITRKLFQSSRPASSVN